MVSQENTERILTLDILRGIAIIGMLIIHAIVFAIFVPDPELYYEILERAHPLILVLLAPLILVSAWFAVFIFVNGVTVGYSFIKEYQREEPNYSKVLYKKIMNGIALILLGSLYAPIFSHISYNNGNEFLYSSVTGSLYLGKWVPVDWSRFLSHSIFATIAYCSIVISIILFIIFSTINRNNNKIHEKVIKLLVIFGILFIILSFILELIEHKIGIHDNLMFSSNYLVAEIWFRFFGDRHSLFPAICFAFPGAVFGIIMHTDVNRRKNLVMNFGFRASLFLFSVFLTSLIFFPQDLIGAVVLNIQPVIIQVANLSVLVFGSTMLFIKFDFHDNQSLVKKRTRFIRQFSYASMTVYVLESLIAVMIRKVFISFGGQNIFPWNFWVDVLFVIIILLFWNYTLQLWKRYNFRGSFEWMIVQLLKISGNRSSRLQIDQTVN